MKIERINELVAKVVEARKNGFNMIDSVEKIVQEESLDPRERLALIFNVPSTRK